MSLTPLQSRLPEPTAAVPAVVDDGSPVLAIKDLHISVHDSRLGAVLGASLSIGRGESVGLVGESGSGKTLTCRAALGVLGPGCKVESGSVRFAGQEVTGLSDREWQRVRGRRVGAVFQDPTSYLNPSIAVGRQLAEVVRTKLGLSRTAARGKAIELFEAVGLHPAERVYGQLPVELSGGMLQRVMIAIAVSCAPELLVADEATTALDVTIQAEIIELILRLRDERGLAVLFVSHDLAVVAELCDRVVVFYAGEVVESGPTAQILEAPQHPYTQALLKVASLGDYGRRELEVIAGRPPVVGAQITGCRFADRCSVAVDECRTAPVAIRSVGPDREARCIRVGEPAVVA
jgi:peptide/nickel transport system ATP-binding protein